MPSQVKIPFRIEDCGEMLTMLGKDWVSLISTLTVATMLRQESLREVSFTLGWAQRLFTAPLHANHPQ